MLTPIYWLNGLPAPGRVGFMGAMKGGAALSGEVRRLREEGARVLVCTLTPREMGFLGLVNLPVACLMHDVRLRMLSVVDRGVPDADADTAAVLDELARAVADGQGVVAMCRAGLGRSVIVAGAVAQRVGLRHELALAMLGHARGRPVPETEEQMRWLRDDAAGLAARR